MLLPCSEIINTPMANDNKYAPVKLASSFNCVNCVIAPAAAATANPAINPPSVIGQSDKPKNKNATDAPGNIACDIASPTSVIRRNTKNTPSGAPPIANAVHATNARRINK